MAIIGHHWPSAARRNRSQRLVQRLGRKDREPVAARDQEVRREEVVGEVPAT
jgi:hypothetical protein